MAEKNINKGVAGRAQNLSNSRAQGVYETIDIKPATAVIGGIVSGVDMTQPIPDAQVQDINHALFTTTLLWILCGVEEDNIDNALFVFTLNNVIKKVE